MESDIDHSEHTTEEDEHLELYNKIGNMDEVLKEMFKSNNPQLNSQWSFHLPQKV